MKRTVNREKPCEFSNLPSQWMGCDAIMWATSYKIQTSRGAVKPRTQREAGKATQRRRSCLPLPRRAARDLGGREGAARRDAREKQKEKGGAGGDKNLRRTKRLPRPPRSRRRAVPCPALAPLDTGGAPARPRDPMRRRPFLDQRRPSSFKRRWQQRPWWFRLAVTLLLALACLFLLLALRGSPDPDPVVLPSTDSSRSAATTSPLLHQVSESRLISTLLHISLAHLHLAFELIRF